MKTPRLCLLLLLPWLLLHKEVSSNIHREPHSAEHKQQCNHILAYNIGTQHCNEITTSGDFQLANMIPGPPLTQKCLNTTQCPLQPITTIINYTPINLFMFAQVRDMLGKCCGHCPGPTYPLKITDVLKNESPALRGSDFIYPVLGSRRSTKLYGYWFLPFMDVPKALYVVKKKSPTEIVGELLMEVLDLWPLLVILLIFAVLAGFVAWVIETWKNTGEFSSAFLIGLFDGFWWAYISMTTVGYGDKTTKTILGKLFSVVWILMGITIFSMLTASLTDMIGKSDRQTSTSMLGKHVTVLDNRAYDMEVVTQHGGYLNVHQAVDIESGIDTLLARLKANGSSFLLDEKTFYFYITQSLLTPEQMKQVREEIIVTEKQIAEDMSFGVLIREESAYWYLAKFVENNWYLMDACRRNLMNNELHQEGYFGFTKVEPGVFSTHGGLFLQTLMYSCPLLAVALVFGFIYEMWRKMREKRGTNIDQQTHGTQLNVIVDRS